MQSAFFITGTDTGVGKTVLTALLARHLQQRGIAVVALKPVASGGRTDARILRAALDGILTLDEINPWHFRAALAPLLAARCERRTVTLTGVLAHVRTMQRRFDAVVVEGAGGLLSPLGENFDSRDLMVAWPAIPIVIGPNRVGVVNQMRLTLAALPRAVAARTRMVLMSPPRLDAAAKTNAGLLAEFFRTDRIFTMPWLGERFEVALALKSRRVRRTLQALIQT